MILWSDWALRQLEEIHAFYAAEANTEVADRIINSILETTRLLEQFPIGGQLEPWLDHLGQGHRHVVVGHYKVIYQVVEDTVRIVDVFDSHQDPERMKV
jgi:plasmid stabilization system protein ParE